MSNPDDTQRPLPLLARNIGAIGKHAIFVLRRSLAWALILSVQAYQMILSPLLPMVCRFQPSCSEYFIQAVRKYGPIRGACKGTWRVCRCNPFSQGGLDPP